jgi:hypothetical protein
MSRPTTITAKASSQNWTTIRRRSVHQRSLPYWVGPKHGALDRPPLADHGAVGQHLPAWLVVMAGVQCTVSVSASGPAAVTVAPASRSPLLSERTAGRRSSHA